MDAIYHLFQTPLILLALVIMSLLALIFIPSSVFEKKKWGWRILMLMVIAVAVFIWFYTQPEQYERAYLKEESVSFEPLKQLADQRGFYFGAAIGNSKEQMRYAQPYFNSVMS